MSEDDLSREIERQLRAALRPVAPRQEFTDELGARAGADTADRAEPAQERGIARRGFGRRGRGAPAWWLAGLAASLLMAAGIQVHLRQERERAGGLEARRQVIEALRVTSQKLDLAYETIKSESTSLSDAASGA